MKCPACKNPLRQKNTGGMAVDACYGGCGGIWFDAAELERVSASTQAATTLHTIWQAPAGSTQVAEARLCPRCPSQTLERKWFSDRQQVEIDQCPGCNGVWLDAGEFTRVYEEVKVARETSPIWLAAIEAVAAEKEGADVNAQPPVV